ncbi:sensor histidine kinase [Haliovirga abyssi]|uniref:histidine kinase n=1 Tax=Haliovirga abyssi TaxID=2996794 RepID=A0AAU9DJA4_9FUSO|nr:HAMP domain-containing sensor histidine kinase [Haliovirga abyssi]BDU49932.1 hypothetical protein HLVA_05010 [Haliovirga abyssi]
MKIFKKWKLSNKLAFTYGFVFLITFATINFVIFRTIFVFGEKEANAQMSEVKEMVKNEINNMVELNKGEMENRKRTYQIAENILKKGFDTYIRIYNDDKIIVNSLDKNIPKFDYKKDIEKSKLEKIGDKVYSVYNLKLDFKGKEMYIQFIMDITRQYGFIKLLRKNMIIGELIGLLISILVGKYLSKSLLKPIKEITKNAKYITINDLSKRVYLSNKHDEIYELGKVLNEMISRLEESFKNQNKFISDASHELRTPLSVMQGYLEIIDGWGKNEKEVLDESIIALKEEVTNMKNLVEKLLFLAKGESGNIKLNKEKVMLNKLVEKVIRDTEIMVPDYKIINNINDEIEVEIDSNLIQQCMRGIIDNSIKYSQVDKKIEINSINKEGIAKISIKDNGIGMEKEELDKVFDRFYRIDESRTKDTGGTGLGLSIVKTIMDLHNGDIKIDSQMGNGTEITMIFKLDVNRDGGD